MAKRAAAGAIAPVAARFGISVMRHVLAGGTRSRTVAGARELSRHTAICVAAARANDAAPKVWVKHENHTPTGAFKMRGGLVYAERLRRERPHVRGIVSATRGNHGQSLAWAGRRYGIAVTVVVPHGNSVEKNAAMRAFGARLIEHGDDFEMAREEAARLAAQKGWSSRRHLRRDLVKGVATYSLELFRAAPLLDALYVPIGLGSGICGAILARDLLGLTTEIIGVQAAGAAAYARSFAEGRVVGVESRRDACGRHGGASAGCRARSRSSAPVLRASSP